MVKYLLFNDMQNMWKIWTAGGHSDIKGWQSRKCGGEPWLESVWKAMIQETGLHCSMQLKTKSITTPCSLKCPSKLKYCVWDLIYYIYKNNNNKRQISACNLCEVIIWFREAEADYSRPQQMFCQCEKQIVKLMQHKSSLNIQDKPLRHVQT